MRPSRTCSSAPEGNGASAIFSSGSWRIRSSISPIRCGPTSMLWRSTRRLPPTGSASAALVGPASRPRQRNALRSPDGVLAARLATAAVLIAGLLAALFYLPSLWLKLVIGAVVALAGFEWGRLCRLDATLYAGLLVAAYGATLWIRPDIVFALAAAFWVAVVPLWLWRGLEARQAGLLAAAGLFVLIPAALAVVALPAQRVLLVLGLTWVADTAAYFIGTRFGRRRLAPSISPSKTWEGAAGGLLGALSYAIICAAFVPQWGGRLTGAQWAVYLAGAALLCAASIVGDLFESAAKRQAGVKDSGVILPGHGGILDRIDSATSTLPLAVVLLPLIVGH